MRLHARLALACALLAAAGGRAPAGGEVPLLSGRVVDDANILSAGTVGAVEALLHAHEDSTSNQVAVLTIASLGGEDLEGYSMRVAEAWKLGTRARDNGVILLVVRDDRKVRIEVGRGLEGSLPDITCGLIIRRAILPRFREGDYDGGVRAGVEAILAALRGSYAPPPAAEESSDIGGKLMAGGIFTVVVGLFTLIVLFARGPQMWFLYIFLLPFWFVFPMALLGLRGGLIALLSYATIVPLARLWMSQTSAGKSLHTRLAAFPLFAGAASSGWTSGSSGSSGGGSSWSSDSGFSGGGGGFSGGGASGSW